MNTALKSNTANVEQVQQIIANSEEESPKLPGSYSLLLLFTHALDFKVAELMTKLEDLQSKMDIPIPEVPQSSDDDLSQDERKAVEQAIKVFYDRIFIDFE